MTNQQNNFPSWIKSKGYIHVTPNIDIQRNWKNIYRKVTNPDFVRKYAFYPLIHSVIKDRKYKKIDPKKSIAVNKKRAHSHKNISTGKVKSAAKERPLHYATHFDSIIYAYYASILQEKYEKKLNLRSGLSACVTAYRKLKIIPELEDQVKGNGKSTIHFAKEVFDEIKLRSITKDVAVLAFDIKSFFSSLNHERLKKVWEYIIDVEELPPDHLAVFKASTQFSYILLDDLRIKKRKNNRKSGFDERKLSNIRKTQGHKCFFESNKDFRDNIKNGNLRIHKHPFYNKEKKTIMGIPQGLPNSAILANMYLLDFDIEIFKNLVIKSDCFYRRYSDDIILICNIKQIESVKSFVEKQMLENLVEISKDKTEIFHFKNICFNKKGENRLTSFKLVDDELKESPLVYLGFEFRGYNTVIKSANIAKYYRRIITIIKRRAKRAYKSSQSNPFQKKAIYKNQIKKLYRSIPKKQDLGNENKLTPKTRKILKLNDKGEFHFENSNSKFKHNSNYFSYLKRVAIIMEDEKITNQLRKSKHIVNSAIRKSLDKNFD